MSNALSILIIATSQATMGNSDHRTGLWLEELTTPYYLFTDGGVQVDIASLQGQDIPLDPASVKKAGENPASVERFLADEKALHKIQHSISIRQVDISRYDAVFLPGGHGTMWDLPASQPLAQLLSSAWAQDKVLAAVCHGPAGLLNVTDANGDAVIKGRNVAGFSNSEETAAGLAGTVPFLLEDKMRALGGFYYSGPDFQAFALRDGNLITGQNPASSEKVAELVLQALNGQ